ncbi:MAG: hypothetical protein KYX68_12250, partial [Flavobacterium sp.]|nr:hypothetical protein [Flavobacterium sp.]
MKLYYRILVLLLITFPVLSQEISEELPVYAPQTPTTADLGKYGEVQVNESTGVISPSIPLFTYKAGDFEIPITLNYSGNGVRVNQDPTWAGINWNINPGGVITRQVNDRPDEITQQSKRLYLSNLDLENLDGAHQVHTSSGICFFDTDTEWFQTLKLLDHSDVDSQVDIFNYNFMGYSGSFYIDINNQPHIIKKDKEINITFISDPNNIIGIDAPSNKSQIIIKTPNGDTYFFGSSFASESSRTWVNNGTGSTTNIPFAQNAFYLYQIVLYGGGVITFEYEDYGSLAQLYKIGISETASVSYPPGLSPCNKKVKQYYGQIQNAVLLKKITNSFNDLEVVFNSNFYGNQDRLIKLNSVELNSGNNQIKKVVLDYLNINNEIGTNNPYLNESKYFLEEVKFYDNANNFVNSYKLEYYNPESFPSKNSFAQDELGFYNGKDNNTTLLPKTGFLLLDENCHFGLADREASLEHSKIGSLKNIIYPTRGFSNFEYELPTRGLTDVYGDFILNAYYRDENRNYTSSTYENINGVNTFFDTEFK